jgi:hypothetical protein
MNNNIFPILQPLAKRVVKSLPIFFSALYFCTNVLWSHSIETNFWKNRQRTVTQMAQLSLNPVSAVSALPRLLESLPSSNFRFEKVASLQAGLADPLLKSLALTPTSMRKVIRPEKNPSPYSVVFIQDIHRNVEAQKNIGRTVESLVEKNQVQLIALEGSFNEVKLQPFWDWSERDILHDVADYFSNQESLSGVGYALLTGQQKWPKILGIDDSVHHTKNISAYQRAIKNISQAKSEIGQWATQLHNQKGLILNKDLAHVDSAIRAYDQGALSLSTYISFLSQKTSNLSQALQVFIQASVLERKLNFKQIEKERNTLLQNLMPTLHPNEITSLLEMSNSYRMGEIRDVDFYQAIQRLCTLKTVSLIDYPAFKSFIEYLIVCESLDSDQLFSDLRQLKNEVVTKVTQTPEENHLMQKTEFLELMQKLSKFSLNRSEWNHYKNIKNES